MTYDKEISLKNRREKRFGIERSTGWGARLRNLDRLEAALSRRRSVDEFPFFRRRLDETSNTWIMYNMFYTRKKYCTRE